MEISKGVDTLEISAKITGYRPNLVQTRNFFSRPNAFDVNNSAIVTKTNKWRAPTQLPTLVGFFQASGKRTEMLKERRDVRGMALNGTREDSVHNWRKKIHKIK